MFQIEAASENSTWRGGAQFVDQPEALFGLDVAEGPAVAGFRALRRCAHAVDRADLVVVEARGEMMTKTGVRYDNEYSLVYPTGARKIVDTPSIAIRRCASRCLARFRKIGRKWRLERRSN
jgi:hypothetical protein